MADIQTEALTFEKVWALLQESLQASRKENDRRWAEETKRREEEEKRREEEAVKEAKHREEEAAKETKRREEEEKRRAEEEKKYQKEMKELNKRMGYLDNRFGELAEHLVAPNILEKFNAMGFKFTWVFPKPFTLKHPINNDIIAEIDIMLLAEDTAVAVEVKAKADQKDVDKHKERVGDNSS